LHSQVTDFCHLVSIAVVLYIQI